MWHRDLRARRVCFRRGAAPTQKGRPRSARSTEQGSGFVAHCSADAGQPRAGRCWNADLASAIGGRHPDVAGGNSADIVLASATILRRRWMSIPRPARAPWRKMIENFIHGRRVTTWSRPAAGPASPSPGHSCCSSLPSGAALMSGPARCLPAVQRPKLLRAGARGPGRHQRVMNRLPPRRRILARALGLYLGWSVARPPWHGRPPTMPLYTLARRRSRRWRIRRLRHCTATAATDS